MLCNNRLCPLKIAGTVSFNIIWLLFVCALIVALISVPAAASFDIVKLVAPGDSSDVLSAGLVMPAEFAVYPDISRPTSLLKYASSISTQFQSSHPWQQTGDNPIHLGGSSESLGINIRKDIRGITTAVAGSVGSSGLEFTEDGKTYTRAKAIQDGYGLGMALALKSTRIGISFNRCRGDVGYRSTALSGIETISGSGIGFISSNLMQTEATVEVTRDWGPLRLGYLSSSTGGSLDLRTMTNRQGYSALSNTHAWRVSPYIIYHRKSVTDIFAFNASNQDLEGPVYMGNILAGSWNGTWKTTSAAYARLINGLRSKRLYSLEYSTTDGDLSGKAGGFVLPGIFNSSYSTKNSISLDQLSARYGLEKTRGKTAIRWSIMLARCEPTGSTYSTQASWLRPRRVLTDEDFENVTMWLVSPAIGAGYTKGDYHIDAGLSLFGGLVQNTNKKVKKPPVPNTPVDSERKQLLPGYRLGITIRRNI